MPESISAALADLRPLGHLIRSRHKTSAYARARIFRLRIVHLLLCAAEMQKMEEAREKRTSMWAGRAVAGIRGRLLTGRDHVVQVVQVSLGGGADLKAATEAGKPFQNGIHHPSEASAPARGTDGVV